MKIKRINNKKFNPLGFAFQKIKQIIEYIKVVIISQSFDFCDWSEILPIIGLIIAAKRLEIPIVQVQYNVPVLTSFDNTSTNSLIKTLVL